MNKTKFPASFLWGTATAAYQIEGAGSEDGRTPCIWDQFAAIPGKVYEAHNGDVACDHYHRYKDDIKLIAELGFKAYRFSIAWPRIFPEKGKLNPKGIEFYANLLKELKKYEIMPAVTIYHWDLPLWIHEEGGWTNRQTVEYFKEFASVLFEHFGEDVPMWITHNEPWCASFLSYGLGVHAPGHTDWNEATAAAHHILLSHGEAVRLYREMGYKHQIGITLNLTYQHPATGSEEDRMAAGRADGFTNRWFLDPVFKGQYPEDMMEVFEKQNVSFDFIHEGDLALISIPCDFLGINYYTRNIVRNNPDDLFLGGESVRGTGSHTDMDWEVYPEGLYILLTRLKAEYTDLPIYITENGAAYADNEVISGTVHDDERVEYFRLHLNAVGKFIENGGDAAGYFCWSFMDNYEWSFGYSKRFGIVYVNYETQERLPKLSAYWLQDVMAANTIE
ncbi:beta-glucosidase [Paenibacillus sp. PR3]|uniref:Beta-glucosidase n=1 Tax=Paenibacillus terricola TaxID=2763503 RepID=A0ABR8MY62_9BACL|nr:GH1 family beta-glucosidase [Paenibacillus terricola]MBD3919875.1 beta-glucosidase [Paenibacillus terricola]